MRRTVLLIVLVTAMIFLMGGSCVKTKELGSDISKPSVLELSSFSEAVPRILDTTIHQVELIDRDHALLLGDFKERDVERPLQIVGPQGLEPVKVNKELVALGKVVAISNVVNQKVAVAIIHADDMSARMEILLALVDLTHMHLEHVSAKISHEPKLDKFRDSEGLFKYFKMLVLNFPFGIGLKLLDSQKIVASCVLLGEPEILIYDARTGHLILRELLPVIDSGRLPWGDSTPTITVSNGRIYAALGHVTDIEFKNIQGLSSVEIHNRGQFAEQSILLYQIDVETGEVIAVQPLASDTERTFNDLILVAANDGLLLSGTSFDDKNRGEFFLTKFQVQPGNDELLRDWFKVISLSDYTDTVKSVSVLSDGRILMAGDTGYVQVPSGSLIKPGDCFVSLLDSKGNQLSLQTFGTRLRDHFESISTYGDNILLFSIENQNLTHNPKNDPYFFEMRRLTIK